MKTIKIIFVITILSFIQSNAQFTDDIESYPLGRYIGNHWDSWDGTIEKAPIVSNDFAHSGEKSMLISNFTSTDCILNLGQKSNGFWHLEWWMYIENNKIAYYSIISGLQPNVSNFINCDRELNQNNSNNYICTDHTPDNEGFSFDFQNAFPLNQWFKIEINVNILNGIDNATIQEIVNNNEVIPIGTPFKLLSNPFLSPDSFGLVNFTSYHNDIKFYIDDILLQEVPLSTADYLNQKIKIYPNPTNSILNIDFNDLEIKSLDLFNVLGSKIKNFKVHDNKLDLSTINSGIYFLNINTNRGKLVKKIVIEK